MRWIVLILMFSQCPLFSQSAHLERIKQVKNIATVYESVGGDTVAELAAYTNVKLSGCEGDETYFVIRCFVDKEDVDTIQVVTRSKSVLHLHENSKLYDFKGEQIGVTKQKLEITSDIEVNGLLRTGIGGYIQQDDLYAEITKETILASKDVMHFEFCNTKIFKKDGIIHKEECDYGVSKKNNLLEEYQKFTIKYYDDYGWPVELSSDCNYVEKNIELKGLMVQALFRIEKTTIKPFGVEKYGPLSQFKVSIYRQENDERVLLKDLKFDADELVLGKQSIAAGTFGFGGNDGTVYEAIPY